MEKPMAKQDANNRPEDPGTSVGKATLQKDGKAPKPKIGKDRHPNISTWRWYGGVWGSMPLLPMPEPRSAVERPLRVL